MSAGAVVVDVAFHVRPSEGRKDSRVPRRVNLAFLGHDDGKTVAEIAQDAKKA